MQYRIVILIAAALLLMAFPARAVTPSADELATARQWTEAAFGESSALTWPAPGLEVQANHDPVLKNNRFGKPLKIGEQVFERGLFCHAPSRILVRLPGPGKMFRATIGVDLNEHTSGGTGSVIFSITVNGETRYTSEVMRGTMPGIPIEIPLDGATEFLLEISDAGDGISCDQADWAEARAVLESGDTVWIDALPMPGGPVLAEAGRLPFSFLYGGLPSAELLAAWPLARDRVELDAQRTQHTLLWRDPKTSLEVRCVAVEYKDFPTVEWTLYFSNTGDQKTPILENIQALDLRMVRGDLGEFTLHHAVGSQCSARDYAPLETKLERNNATRLSAAGGRPTNSDMSYFNIESTCGDGAIVVVGWPGQWAAEFARDDQKTLAIRAGQELTHFSLFPGESVRSPLSVLQFWKGGYLRSQNLWRRWMMAHSMPKPGGALPQPMLLASSSRAYEEMIKTDEEKQIMFIDRYLEEKIPIDYWWMDAGWYIQEKGWPQVGTWEVDPKRFPNGFKKISEHAHAHGIKILVWFEPERVAAGTWLAENHPEWIFGGKKGGLLNLGNPEAWHWLVEHVDTLLKEQGIDLYRQDFNMDPLDYWRKNDSEDRQGITEIKHVTAYLAYWDELRHRHPDMLIDSCASGGRRNDLETMRRAVPLWRSDYAFEPLGHQGMTYGLSLWLPYHGTGTVATANAGYYGGGYTPVESYAFWSNAGASISLGFDLRVREIDYAALRGLFRQWQEISPLYYGDFYPLTPYSLDPGNWMAWQFNRPEQGDGMVQIFRRDQSIYVAAALPLHDLDPDARYTLTNLADGVTSTMTGREMMDQGLPVNLTERPAALVMQYQQIGSTNKEENGVINH
jgi:alpha-galactosidase